MDMQEIWAAYYDVILLIMAAILVGVVAGIRWGQHSIKAPFRERRVERRTLIQRLRWFVYRRLRPAGQHS